jgi:hypothetical protein
VTFLETFQTFFEGHYAVSVARGKTFDFGISARMRPRGVCRLVEGPEPTTAQPSNRRDSLEHPAHSLAVAVCRTSKEALTP